MGAINHLICLPVQVMKIFYLRNFDVSAFYQNSRRYDQRIFADDNKSCDLVIASLAVANTAFFKQYKISDKNLSKTAGCMAGSSNRVRGDIGVLNHNFDVRINSGYLFCK